MSSKPAKSNVQSNVRAAQTRQPGEAPAIGSVARIHKRSKELQESKLGRASRKFGRGKRANPTGNHSHLTLFWLAMLLLGTCAVIVAGMFLWLRAQSDRRNLAGSRAQAFVPAGESRVSRFPPPSEAVAMRIFQGALAARSEESISLYVRETPEVPVGQQISFLAETETRDGSLTQHRWIGTIEHETLQVQAISVHFDKNGRAQSRIAMLVPDSAGNWRLDFPAFARWCDPPIQLIDTADGHPGGRVRVFLQLDNYYNGIFANDREWICFRIDSPDAESSAYVYAAAGSPAHLALFSLLSPNVPTIPVTLEIERREGAEPRQFALTSVLADGWILTDTPFDSTFSRRGED